MREVDADVVVVGSGATGGWVCKALTEASLSVLLLDAAPAIRAADCPSDWYDAGAGRQAPDDTRRQFVQMLHPAYCAGNHHLWVDDVDHPYVTDGDKPFVWIRSRTEGGRSNLWGGQCWRLTEREFGAPLADGFGEPWPLDYRTLEPYYEAVERFQGVRGRNDGAEQMPDQIVTGEVDVTPAEARLAQRVRERWGRVAIPSRAAVARRQSYRDAGEWPRFSSLGSTLPDALASGRIRIVNDACVARLATGAGGRRVERAHYIDAASGREKNVSARAFVLCASTLESTRILFNSADAKHPDGLGNASGTLGRYLMDHNASFVAGQVSEGVVQGADYFGGRNGIYLPRFEDAGEAPGFLRGYGVWITLGRDMGQGMNALMTAVGEMLPYADNRARLHERGVDRWGIPVLRIDCVGRDNERRMRAHQRASLRALAEEAGMSFAQSPVGATPGAMVHEVGTARMGRDRGTSFCNHYARSWEVENLFTPDGACWTTSAYQNPTLTMMALALRSARHVAQWLESGST